MARIPSPPSEPDADEVPEIVNEASEERPPTPKPPAITSLLLEIPLYQRVMLESPRDEDWFSGLRFGGIQFDAYCVHCKRESIFRTFRGDLPQEVKQAKEVAKLGTLNGQLALSRLVYGKGQFGVHLACQRRGHMYSYYFSFDGADLEKIGQTPSLEDVAGADLEKYRKILGNHFAEMKRAGGLISHGVGIGAFVYLRRIFERLVEDARAAIDPEGNQKVAFYQLRMADRIDALKATLPATVVQYKDAYGILSKGLHELTEDECKRHFPVVRAAIIAMLEERYEAEQKKRAADDLKRAVDAAAATIKGSK